MLSLFSDLSRPAGFRLHELEVLNWGTFDAMIHRVEARGQTTLLTGANGAGKTTLVDALLTLLTPPGRFYNQSSGAESRQDRNEKTYVLGHYGHSAQDGYLEARPDALRLAGCHSVLLACFRDERGGLALTLAQVRRYQPQGGLKTDFLVVPQALGIAELGALDGAGEWKRRLRRQYPAPGPVLFDSFRDYSDALRRALGMRSEKALTLFGKAVSLKVVGKLNEFIREHMLEPGSAEEDFRKLQGQYQQLREAHQALEKATEQLRLLEPLPGGETRLRQLEARLAELADVRGAVRYLLTQRHQTALEQDYDRRADELATLQHQLAGQATQLEADRQRQREVERAIQQDDASHQLDSLNAEIATLTKELGEQQTQRADYNALAAELRLPPAPADDRAFALQQEAATDLLRDTEAAMTTAAETAGAAQLALQKLTERHDFLREEVSRLAGQPPTNIPRRELELRAGLSRQLRISPAELPFAGELLRVRDDAADWEPALEKLLHRFALQLLVPPPHYAALTAYVNTTDLRGLLVYQRVEAAPLVLAGPGRAAHPQAPTPDPHTVSAKLDLHPDSPHRAWLDQQLRSRFPHVCAADAAELQRLDQALTREGLVRNRSEHRKDDRPPDRTAAADYVLGWNSAAKLHRFEQLLREAASELQDARQAQQQAAAQRAAQQRTRDALRDLLKFDRFARLDADATATAIARRQQDRDTLLNSPGAERLRQLHEQIKQLAETLEKTGADRDKNLVKSGELKRQLADLQGRLDAGQRELEQTALPTAETISAAAPYLPAAGGPAPTVAALDRLREQARDRVDTDFGLANKEHRGVEQLLLDAMRAFARPGRELEARFPDWSGDVPAGTLDLDLLPPFLALHRRISQQELPQQRQKFEKYLREEAADGIVYFRESLKTQADALTRYVAELNGSLRGITFNHQPAPTYIQLVQRPAPSQQVREFRLELEQAVPDQAAIRRDPAAQLDAFQRVQRLLERLHNQPDWRQQVTDVRNWSVFQAQEFFQADQQPVPGKLYDGSGSLSGGEAAQLTYTVLGAALAYQFGLNRQQQGGPGDGRSFRFLVVDEAFSKLDPDKSRYLMELCQQLQLQVLVVTPDDKITVVEDFIAACHYVVCRDKKHSFVHNLPIEDYRARRQQFAEGSLSEAIEAALPTLKLSIAPTPLPN